MNAKRLSGIMKHNVAPPVKVAAHWVEHALLHGGAYLRSTAGTLSVVQYYLLDVIFVGAGMMIATVTIVTGIFWLLCCRTSDSREKIKKS